MRVQEIMACCGACQRRSWQSSHRHSIGLGELGAGMQVEISSGKPDLWQQQAGQHLSMSCKARVKQQGARGKSFSRANRNGCSP